MLRGLKGIMVVSLLLCCGVLCAECEAATKGTGAHDWWAPDSAWAARITAVRGREKLAALLERRPEKFSCLLMLEVMAEEEGEWFWIRMKLAKVERVTFTKNSRVIITAKDYGQIESEGIFFWPDELQTSLYDSRKGPVVVSENSVWRGTDNANPTGCVKFPAGSVRADEILTVEIVGAVAQDDRGGDKQRR